MKEIIKSILRPDARIHVLNPISDRRLDAMHSALVAPAHHNFFELAICYEGEMSFVGHCSTILLKKGDAVIVKPAAWHYESYCRPDRPYKLCWLYATPQLAGSILTCYSPTAFRITEHGTLPMLEEVTQFKKIVKEESEQSLHWRLNAKSLLAGMLIDFDRRKQSAGSIPNLQELDPVKKLLHITKARFREPLQIKNLAKEVGMSADHLSKRLHAACGMTFKNYLNGIRIHHAQQLLKSGWSIKETADECGFQDVYYFSRVFKQRCKISPGQFLRAARINN